MAISENNLNVGGPDIQDKENLSPKALAKRTRLDICKSVSPFSILAI